MEFACNNGYQASIGMTLFEALYGRPCRSPMCWTDVREVTWEREFGVCARYPDLFSYLVRLSNFEDEISLSGGGCKGSNFFL